MYFLGFSFTEHNDGYATNFSSVGLQLFEALIQFYTMFPEQRTNPFYIIAESYGGKYIANKQNIHCAVLQLR